MKTLAQVLGMVVAVASFAQEAAAQLPSLPMGGDRSGIERALKSAGFEGIEWIAREAPNGLRRGLVGSKLLEALNRFALTPLDAEGRLDVAAFEVMLLARKPGARLALALSERGRRVFLLRFEVPVDTQQDHAAGSSPERLSPLRRALAALGAFSPVPRTRDDHGNTFEWSGKRGSEVLRAAYLPEQDALWVVVAQGS